MLTAMLTGYLTTSLIRHRTGLAERPTRDVRCADPWVATEMFTPMFTPPDHSQSVYLIL
jgi:hypothetical protein